MSEDRFTEKLHCPKCGREGIANLSQEDGWAFVKGNTATAVDHIPAGFKIVKQNCEHAEVEIFCVACDVSVMVRRS